MEAYIEITLSRFEKRKIFGYKKISQRIGFLFDMYCWLHMSEKENIALDDLGKWPDDVFMENICFYAAVSSCKDRGAKITFSKNDIKEWIRLMPQQDFQKIYDTMMRSRIMGKSLEDWAKENMTGDSKKKSMPQKSMISQSVNSESREKN